MTINDLELTTWEREAKNRMRDLADAIRDKTLWDVIQASRQCEAALRELRLRAIHLGFERHPPYVYINPDMDA